jgi:hypothetical protein
MIGATICATLQFASAATVALPGDYGLRLMHRSVTPPAGTPSDAKQSLELTLINAGAKDLHDVRLLLIQADGVGIVSREQPARVRSLPIGGQAVMQVTLATHGGRLPSGHSLLFRIEAVDNATQEIVVFAQPSTEAR